MKRYWAVGIIFALCILALVSRLVYLQVVNQGFLSHQGDVRSIRHITIPPKRGMIVDRYGAPLAVSTPVAAVAINPRELNTKDPNWQKVLQLLQLNSKQVSAQIASKKGSGFMYLKRQLPPDLAAKIDALDVRGVYIQPEYRRYYPSGEMLAQVLGFTNIDDQGQEGLELYYNDWLTGTAGSKTILRDLKGRAIDQVGDYVPAEDGKPIALSIDRRIQYLTYRALSQQVEKFHAAAGSAIVMDVRTGEILALANVPSFNPNNRTGMKPDQLRNRAVTDVFEPGSTMKTFSAVAILESGLYTPESKVDTAPGYVVIGNRTIHDVHPEGVLDLAGVLQKSSNVGISRFILNIPWNILPTVAKNIGFGKPTGIDFPGESAGVLPKIKPGQKLPLASMAFGYGISCTLVQLAQAYAALADNGIEHTPTLLRQDQVPAGRQVMPSKIANQVLAMLQNVIEEGGTGIKASVMGYQVAGKTGTSRKVVNGHYQPGKYISLFAGAAPLNNPRLVMVVMIDEPHGSYYGGTVAGPVFAQVMQQSLRLLAIPPDKLSTGSGK
jgi:cell division protein FtsI (penicillin-binding protein 3)